MADVPVKQHRKGCTIEGCERRHYALGYCELHRDRVKTTGSARGHEPPRLKREALYDATGKRFCHECRRYLGMGAFHGTGNVCIRCRQVRHFGLNAAQWEAQLAEQGGRCAVCLTDSPGGHGWWHTDHDHACCAMSRNTCGQCVRGILCSACNTAIGLLMDDPVRLRRAAAYLESYTGVSDGGAPQPEDTRPPEAVA